MISKDQVYWDEVVGAVLAGDVDRYREIVLQYQDQMRFAVAFYFRGNGDRVEEIVHLAFIKAFQALNRFEKGRPLAPWLIRIVKNEAFREISRIDRESSRTKELIQATVAESRENAEPPFAQIETLRFCMGKLKDSARSLVKMRYFEKKSFLTIADEIDRSAKGLRVAMLRIRKELKVCIEGQVPE